MKNFFTGKKIRILLHLLAWSILLGLPIYFINRWQVGNDFIWLYYINISINGIIFYSNYLFLVPRFFFGGKKYRYYLSVLVFVGAFYFVSDYSNKLVFQYSSGNAISEQIKKDQDVPNKKGRDAGNPEVGKPPYREIHMFNYTLTSLFLVFFSLGLRVLERYSQIERGQKELEREKLNSELAFLKNQVSPHFFFNTLNNIYSLISINAEDSQKAVLKLSKLMRYLLYESENGNTHLSNEIEFMNNYIDLMKLRMSDKIRLDVSFPEKYEDISIPPLLFIPFIENAFKHGISYRDKSFIDIKMLVTERELIFKCANSLLKSTNARDGDHSGIGLENVRKRLGLIFPGKHDLVIRQSETEFEVSLHINFT